MIYQEVFNSTAMRCLTLSTAVLFSVISSVHAVPGDADTSFGVNGVVTTDIGSDTLDFSRATALQPDGKIIVVGRTRDNSDPSPRNKLAAVRYNADGSLDTAFGSNGVVVIDTGDDASAEGVMVQADGRILLGGYARNGSVDDFLVARLNQDGSIDTSYGAAGGMVTTQVGGTLTARAMALQADGKVVVVGRGVATSGSDFFVARYTAGGSLDTSFDSDGLVSFDFGSTDVAEAVTIQQDGKILVVGTNALVGASTNRNFAIVRLNGDGSLDTTFGSTGMVSSPLRDGLDSGYAVAVQNDGRIVVAGASETAESSGSYDVAVLRYTTDGALDTTFGNNGSVIVPVVATGIDEVFVMVIQSDGKIVLAGRSNDTSGVSNSDYLMLRLNSDGSLDTGFDSDGIWTLDTGSVTDRVESMLIQPDGKLVLSSSTSNDMGVLRFLNDAAVGNVTPDAIVYADEPAAAFGTLVTTANMTVAGLGAGVQVPVTVSGGEYAINAGAYTAEKGYVQNGDQISVRHTAGTTEGETVTTSLVIGGIESAGNRALILGQTMTASFSSTATATSDSGGSTGTTTSTTSGGGGVWTWLSLLLVAVPLMRRRS